MVRSRAPSAGPSAHYRFTERHTACHEANLHGFLQANSRQHRLAVCLRPAIVRLRSFYVHVFWSTSSFLPSLRQSAFFWLKVAYHILARSCPHRHFEGKAETLFFPSHRPATVYCRVEHNFGVNQLNEGLKVFVLKPFHTQMLWTLFQFLPSPKAIMLTYQYTK